MPLSNPEKILNTHPWEKIIKDAYTSKMRYVHNSIRNPQYPKKKGREPHPNHIQFSIIGNRTTKEFIYCVKLVKGMHKYRGQFFDAPIIRGVTCVEWPAVWNDLKIKHGGLAFCIRSQVAVLLNGNFLGGDKELKELIESKYIYHIHPDYYQEAVGQFACFIRSSGRSCAYMHIAIDEEHIGTLIFMLYSEIVPYTSENFLRLCNTKRGGYGGTPIHRIVKDGWIQCGGYALKNTEMDCENFIIPHDRRGVLGMANDGRHIDCSTQFFVLLQPAPWMAQKYVAFGQLIDGEETLKKIESVPTWYESPKRSIVIYRAGIFNMECQDIVINKRTKEYIQGHIENLITIGELFYEALLEKVFLEAELRILEALRKKDEVLEEQEEDKCVTLPDSNLHETKRFIRNKEDIQKQLENSQIETHRNTTVIIDAEENNEFDVDEYVYEPEENTYKHVSMSIAGTVSVTIKPEKPFYIPLTDVPYPGEVDSTYDLKKLLKGDYCLESDLEAKPAKRLVLKGKEIFLSNTNDEGSVLEEDESLDSDDEREIQKYLKMNADHVSFADGVIKNIAKNSQNFNILDALKRKDLLSDEVLRQLKLASKQTEFNDRGFQDKKVSISVPDTGNGPHSQIKRRQTGFIHPADLSHTISQTVTEEEQDSAEFDMSRKVRITAAAAHSNTRRPSSRRPTGFVRPYNKRLSEIEEPRQSVLTRLYDDVTYDDDDQQGPTLKDYKPIGEGHRKSFTLLTFSPSRRIKYEDDQKQRYPRHSITVDDDSYEKVLNMQHGKKIARKISSDYVKTIDQIEHKLETSIRSVEYSKTRPAMSVMEYQLKNQKYMDEQKRFQTTVTMKPLANFDKKQSIRGLRLPGDTPLYSQSLQHVEVPGNK